ncbi:hypothetical protein Pint_34538 [Pistacia integerrima]|uniref:Uncharacterized protein n=1 Tax=Pistacia integerrima TaxID=434235 RepID=A0ACC0X5Y0_9ROSI|nr:hypothetical protein Pint_34538 [Pistacia integerrima]
MSAVVETWMGEFAKLREKVRARKQLSSTVQKKEQQFVKKKEEEEVEEKESKKVVERETTMSEATVCLLMDRFVPW